MVSYFSDSDHRKKNFTSSPGIKFVLGYDFNQAFEQYRSLDLINI